MGRAALLLACAAALGGVAAAPATPAALRARLAATGAERTVAALAAGRGAGWTAVLRHVGGGEPGWLALVPELKPGTDAATSEALDAALSDALAVAPARVLPLAPSVLPLERLCRVPLIEPTGAQVARYRAARLAALARVRDPGQRPAAQACRRLLSR